MDYLKVALWVAEIVFGIGFVIFFHELGHFIMAKRNGVRVELFSLGFGRPIWKRRWGETEYRIAWIPLGGFVSMAGEQGQEGDVPQPYELASKTAWQRLQIFSAGAIMNLLLAFPICILAFLLGKEQHHPVVGVPGVAESLAGMLPGDEIQAIDGDDVTTLEDYKMSIAGKETGKPVKVRVLRDGQFVDLSVVQRGAMQHGVRPTDTIVGELDDKGLLAKAGLKVGDRITGVRQVFQFAAGAPMKEIEETLALAPDDRVFVDGKEIDLKQIEGAVAVTVERAVCTADRLFGDVFLKNPGREITLLTTRGDVPVTIPAKETTDLPRDERMIEPVIGDVMVGTPSTYDAFNSNGVDDTLREGDRVVSADGQPVKSFAELRSAVEAGLGREVTLEISRKVAAPDSHPLFGGMKWYAVLGMVAGGTLLLMVWPIRRLYLRGASPGKQWTIIGAGVAASAGLAAGLYLFLPPASTVDQRVTATLLPTHGQRGRGTIGISAKPTDMIADVAANGVFERAGLKAGDQLVQVGSKTSDVSVEDIFKWKPEGKETELKLHVRREGEKKTVEITIKPEPRTVADVEALGLKPAVDSFYRRWGLKEAVIDGVNEPVRIAVLTVGLLKKLLTGAESAKGMAGPVGIFQFSYRSAQVGSGNFLWLLALITVNLGIFNLLPVPALDGGHIALLAYEVAARRKPSPQFAMAYQVVGLLLLLALIVFVTFNDIERALGG